MFGKNIKSFRHLVRVIDSDVVYPCLIRVNQGMLCIGFVLKEGNNLHVYNSFLKSTDAKYDGHNLYDIASSFGCAMQIVYNIKLPNLPREYERRIFNEFILLGKDFMAKYADEVSKKPYSECISNIGCSSRDARTIYAYVITEGSRHLFQWAMSCIWKNRIDEATVRRAIIWTEKYPQLAKKLKKGTITAYSGFRQICSLLAEQSALRKEKRAIDVINTFNTEQKKLFKGNISDDMETMGILSKFATLSRTKRENFIKKCSSVEDYRELITMLRHVTSSHFDWSKESLMDYISNVENINAKVVFESDTCVLVQVNDYETIKRLGKMTNWCIGKNMSYWNQYVGKRDGAKQFMLFDFTKKEDDNLSIVGFTSVKNKGITNAHNFVNVDITSSTSNGNGLMLQILNSYANNLDRGTSIYSVLAKNGVDMSMVTEFESAPYKWNHDAFMAYLTKTIPMGFYRVIKDEGGMLVLSIQHDNFGELIGPMYYDYIDHDYFGYEHILFADFSKSEFDNGRLSFTIILPGGYEEDAPLLTYNAQCREIGGQTVFEALVVQFGLPYDVIRRTNNIYKRYENEIRAYKLDTLALVLNDKKLMSKVDVDLDTIYSMVYTSITEYYSSEMLTLIYGSGESLTSLFGIKQVFSIVRDSITRIANSVLRGAVPNYIPTQEDMDSLEHREITSDRVLDFLFSWKVLNLMLDHEPIEALIRGGLLKQLVGNISFNLKVIDAIMTKLFERNKDAFMGHCMTNDVLSYITSHASSEFRQMIIEASKQAESARHA